MKKRKILPILIGSLMGMVAIAGVLLSPQIKAYQDTSKNGQPGYENFAELELKRVPGTYGTRTLIMEGYGLDKHNKTLYQDETGPHGFLTDEFYSKLWNGYKVESSNFTIEWQMLLYEYTKGGESYKVCMPTGLPTLKYFANGYTLKTTLSNTDKEVMYTDDSKLTFELSPEELAPYVDVGVFPSTCNFRVSSPNGTYLIDIVSIQDNQSDVWTDAIGHVNSENLLNYGVTPTPSTTNPEKTCYGVYGRNDRLEYIRFMPNWVATPKPAQFAGLPMLTTFDGSLVSGDSGTNGRIFAPIINKVSTMPINYMAIPEAQMKDINANREEAVSELPRQQAIIVASGDINYTYSDKGTPQYDKTAVTPLAYEAYAFQNSYIGGIIYLNDDILEEALNRINYYEVDSGYSTTIILKDLNVFKNSGIRNLRLPKYIIYTEGNSDETNPGCNRIYADENGNANECLTGLDSNSYIKLKNENPDFTKSGLPEFLRKPQADNEKYNVSYVDGTSDKVIKYNKLQQIACQMADYSMFEYSTNEDTSYKSVFHDASADNYSNYKSNNKSITLAGNSYYMGSFRNNNVNSIEAPGTEYIFPKALQGCTQLESFYVYGENTRLLTPIVEYADGYDGEDDKPANPDNPDPTNPNDDLIYSWSNWKDEIYEGVIPSDMTNDEDIFNMYLSTRSTFFDEPFYYCYKKQLSPEEIAAIKETYHNVNVAPAHTNEIYFPQKDCGWCIKGDTLYVYRNTESEAGNFEAVISTPIFYVHGFPETGLAEHCAQYNIPYIPIDLGLSSKISLRGAYHFDDLLIRLERNAFENLGQQFNITSNREMLENEGIEYIYEEPKAAIPVRYLHFKDKLQIVNTSTVNKEPCPAFNTRLKWGVYSPETGEITMKTSDWVGYSNVNKEVLSLIESRNEQSDKKPLCIYIVTQAKIDGFQTADPYEIMLVVGSAEGVPFVLDHDNKDYSVNNSTNKEDVPIKVLSSRDTTLLTVNATADTNEKDKELAYDFVNIEKTEFFEEFTTEEAQKDLFKDLYCVGYDACSTSLGMLAIGENGLPSNAIEGFEFTSLVESTYYNEDGTTVYDENGNPVKVIKLYLQAPKEVFEKYPMYSIWYYPKKSTDKDKNAISRKLIAGQVQVKQNNFELISSPYIHISEKNGNLQTKYIKFAYNDKIYTDESYIYVDDGSDNITNILEDSRYKDMFEEVNENGQKLQYGISKNSPSEKIWLFKINCEKFKELCKDNALDIKLVINGTKINKNLKIYNDDGKIVIDYPQMSIPYDTLKTDAKVYRNSHVMDDLNIDSNKIKKAVISAAQNGGVSIDKNQRAKISEICKNNQITYRQRDIFASPAAAPVSEDFDEYLIYSILYYYKTTYGYTTAFQKTEFKISLDNILDAIADCLPRVLAHEGAKNENSKISCYLYIINNLTNEMNSYLMSPDNCPTPHDYTMLDESTVAIAFLRDYMEFKNILGKNENVPEAEKTPNNIWYDISQPEQETIFERTSSQIETESDGTFEKYSWNLYTGSGCIVNTSSGDIVSVNNNPVYASSYVGNLPIKFIRSDVSNQVELEFNNSSGCTITSFTMLKSLLDSEDETCVRLHNESSHAKNLVYTDVISLPDNGDITKSFEGYFVEEISSNKDAYSYWHRRAQPESNPANAYVRTTAVKDATVINIADLANENPVGIQATQIKNIIADGKVCLIRVQGSLSHVVVVADRVVIPTKDGYKISYLLIDPFNLAYNPNSPVENALLQSIWMTPGEMVRTEFGYNFIRNDTLISGASSSSNGSGYRNASITELMTPERLIPYYCSSCNVLTIGSTENGVGCHRCGVDLTEIYQEALPKSYWDTVASD